MNSTASCLAVLVASSAAMAEGSTTDARVAELSDQVRQLQTELAALRAPDPLDEQRAVEIRAVVNDVLADADTRASMLSSSAMGYDGGFVINEGAFKLKINGQIQFRYVLNLQDENSGDTTRSGFEMRRTKLSFGGTVFDERWSYLVQGAFDRTGGAFDLEEAEISYDLGNGWEARMGQFKAPFMREELVSSKRQLTVERSLVNEEFNQDRSQGIELGYADDTMRFAAMYNDGINGDNVAALTEDTEWAIAARAEFLVNGDWKQFKDFTSMPGGNAGLMLGAAIHYQKDEYGTATGPEVEDLRVTADASFEWDGANLFGAFVWQNLDDGAMLDADRYGFVAQGGYFITPNTEIFARYEYGDYDSMTVEDLNVITVGFNRYWNKHGLKWTTDVGFGIDEVDSAWASSGAGYRADAANEDGQVVIRSQLQLTF